MSKTLKKTIAMVLALSMVAAMTVVTASAATATQTGTKVKIDIPFDDADASLFTSVNTGTPAEETTGWWMIGGQLKYGKVATDGTFSALSSGTASVVYTNQEYNTSGLKITVGNSSQNKNYEYVWFGEPSGKRYRLNLNYTPGELRRYTTASTATKPTYSTVYYVNGENINENGEAYTSDNWGAPALRNTSGETYTIEFVNKNLIYTVSILSRGNTYTAVSTYTDNELFTSGAVGFGGNGAGNGVKLDSLSIEYPKVYGYGLTAEKSESTVSGSFKIGNNTDASQNAFIVVAGYDSTMTMKDVDVIEELSSVATGSTAATQEFTLTGSDIENVCVYIWDGANTITPYLPKLEATVTEAAAE